MSPRRRQAASLKRTTAARPERRTIVVFTEGKNSEPDYVNGLKQLPHIARNVALNVELHPTHGVPLKLVRLAVERSADPEIDECWCLFDVEWPRNHPNLEEARALARKHGILLAITNPCFELWLVLHYQDFDKFCTTADIERISRGLDKRSGKSLEAAQYLPSRAKAARRAHNLEKRHLRDGTVFPHDNPSSGMAKFLTAVEGAATRAGDP
ncbi:RloB-like protein [Amycolatopsis sulphurea]|uniref:RloB-like protein n=1 Tax=Amycolatopsis sulphurea TaxID=76022 RepID=A0A2A9G2A4_9PSEU|nr:RloB family protein [Amycolatopsis sulphurea]PFG56789.1 RloB-like protein [Amycolatopsis sulphurea]